MWDNFPSNCEIIAILSSSFQLEVWSHSDFWSFVYCFLSLEACRISLVLSIMKFHSSQETYWLLIWGNFFSYFLDDFFFLSLLILLVLSFGCWAFCTSPVIFLSLLVSVNFFFFWLSFLRDFLNFYFQSFFEFIVSCILFMLLFLTKIIAFCFCLWL